MRLITKNSKTKPLNGMKNDQYKTKKQVINYRYGIRDQFLHA
jgi:hypothetical protein